MTIIGIQADCEKEQKQEAALVPGWILTGNLAVMGHYSV